jgi:hypothetical protein
MRAAAAAAHAPAREAGNMIALYDATAASTDA